MKTVMLATLARLPPARLRMVSICEKTCFTCASKLFAMSLPALSRVAVWPATHTVLPPSVITPGEKARDSWKGVFSMYSAACAATGNASKATINPLMVSPSFVGVGMKRDAVAFAVDNYRAEAVRPDARDLFRDAAAELLGLLHRVANAAVGIHVDEDSLGARFPRHEAAAVAARMLEHRELEAAGVFLRDLDAEHRAVEPARALEVGYRKVEPYDAIAHLDISFAQWNL